MFPAATNSVCLAEKCFQRSKKMIVSSEVSQSGPTNTRSVSRAVDVGCTPSRHWTTCSEGEEEEATWHSHTQQHTESRANDGAFRRSLSTPALTVFSIFLVLTCNFQLPEKKNTTSCYHQTVCIITNTLELHVHESRAAKLISVSLRPQTYQSGCVNPASCSGFSFGPVPVILHGDVFWTGTRRQTGRQQIQRFTGRSCKIVAANLGLNKKLWRGSCLDLKAWLRCSTKCPWNDWKRRFAHLFKDTNVVNLYLKGKRKICKKRNKIPKNYRPGEIYSYRIKGQILPLTFASLYPAHNKPIVFHHKCFLWVVKL